MSRVRADTNGKRRRNPSLATDAPAFTFAQGEASHQLLQTEYYISESLVKRTNTLPETQAVSKKEGDSGQTSSWAVATALHPCWEDSRA